MKLLRVFVAPYSVFSKSGSSSWVLPFLAATVLSIITGILLANSIGVDVIMRRAAAARSRTDPHAFDAMTVYISWPFGMVLGLLGISLITWLVLRMLRRASAADGARYVIVLAVCSYAAYMREVARLLVTSAVVSWHRLSRVPLASSDSVPTSVVWFLSGVHSRRFLVLMRSLDVLTLGFLVLVAVGLWKSVPGLRLRRAAAVTIVSWLVYVGLWVSWRR